MTAIERPATHRIILGDSRRMGLLEDRSVHLVVTSPPYWQLKDYGHADQIGFNDTYEQYINHLNLVWSECARALHDGCRLCVNIGDQFARSTYYGRYKVIPIRTEVIRFCETIGLDYMGAIIWQKATTCNTSGGGVIMGSFPNPRNGIVKIDYEFILIFKKPGNAPVPTPEAKAASAMSREEWNAFFYGHWNFPGARQDKHIAMFPEELPARLIRMFTFAGETVLDPFLGSGTTSLAAMHLGRSSVGYEKNADFIPVIRTKLGVDQPDMLAPQEVAFDSCKPPSEEEIQAAFEALPYRFRDPIPVDEKEKAKREKYESRIGAEAPEAREAYYKIEEILSPDRIVLDSGERLRLLGVVPIAGKEEAAVRFLREQTGKRKVFLKFDKRADRDEQGDRFCYLCLQNQTHLNAHLIKYGLARPDTSRDYRHRKRFVAHNGLED